MRRFSTDSHTLSRMAAVIGAFRVVQRRANPLSSTAVLYTSVFTYHPTYITKTPMRHASSGTSSSVSTAVPTTSASTASSLKSAGAAATAGSSCAASGGYLKATSTTAHKRTRRAPAPPTPRARRHKVPRRRCSMTAAAAALDSRVREARPSETTGCSPASPNGVGTSGAAAKAGQPRTRHSSKQLRNYLSVSAMVTRMVSLVQNCTQQMSEWSQGASDRVLRQHEKQLELAIQKGTLDTYATLHAAMQKRYEDPIGGSRCDVGFLLLYARVLTNYGAFSLVNFEPQRAVLRLHEAIALVREASALRGDASEATHSPWHPPEAHQKRRAEEKHRQRSLRSIDPETKAAASTSTLTDPGETSIVYLRILLANAYACEECFWQAAEQLQAATAVMNHYPGVAPPQLAPGMVGRQFLSATFVNEEVRSFMSNRVRMQQAISQGRARLLLLQSQGADTARVLYAQLTLARLHRHAGQFKASQRLYEAYLDGLVGASLPDLQCVTAEFGRMLCLEASKREEGLVYLEAAGELLCEDAEDYIRMQPAPVEEEDGAVTGSTSTAAPLDTNSPSATQVHTPALESSVCVRAAGVLLDTALVLHDLLETGRAITLMEKCLSLLHRSGNERVSAWVVLRYADMLASVFFVDKALEQYTRAGAILQESAFSAPSARQRRSTGRASYLHQLGRNQTMIQLPPMEVELHLAYCIETYVRDYRRAMQHYDNVFQHITSSRGRRARSGSQIAEEALTSSADILHWALSNYVGCCERVQDWEAAVVAQSSLVEFENAVVANVAEQIPSFLKLVELLGHTNNVEKLLPLYFFLFFLPDEMLAAEVRLMVAHGFAKCCYLVGNQRMGTILLHSVQYVTGNYNPAMLINYALSLGDLESSDCAYLEGGLDLKTNMEAIFKVFRKATRIMMAHRVVDAANGVVRPNSEELNALITLNRGAFTVLTNGFVKEAEELYAAALMIVDEVMARHSPIASGEVAPRHKEADATTAASGVPSDDAMRGDATATSLKALPESFIHEVGVLLANYASLKTSTDRAVANAMYERAAMLPSLRRNLADMVADHFVFMGDFAKGSAYIKRMMVTNPETTVDMRMKIARLGVGSEWERLNRVERVDVLEHLLVGLGVAPERLPPRDSAIAQSEEAFQYHVDLLGPLLLDGVAICSVSDSVCHANYTVHTRLNRPRLLNDLYKTAIGRFPESTTLLVNYAKLCGDCGYHNLARMYYARAYATSDGDLTRTVCYANYLFFAYSHNQSCCSEALYRSLAQRYPQDANPQTHYADFVAKVMPSPFTVERYFERAMQLDPHAANTYNLYADFVWSSADTPVAHADVNIKVKMFDKVEHLLREATRVSPDSVHAWLRLSTFLAKRTNRFEDTVTTLQKAHQLEPTNVEVVRALSSVLVEECVRVLNGEQQQGAKIAKSGVPAPGTPGLSKRTAALAETAQQSLEMALQLDPSCAQTLEQYATFATTVLRNPKLAAELWTRRRHLDNP